MVLVHSLNPGAFAETLWLPVSTGMGAPHSARATASPSRVTDSPSSGFATVIVTRASFAASASAWRWAIFTSCDLPAPLATLAASRYVAHAVAARPTFSQQLARLSNVPGEG